VDASKFMMKFILVATMRNVPDVARQKMTISTQHDASY